LNKQPLFILAICFISGIFFQDYFCLDEDICFLIAGFAAVIVIFSFLTSYFFFKIRPYLLGFMFFSMGIFIHRQNTFSSENISVPRNENIKFKISKKLNTNEKNKKYEAVIQAGHQQFNAVLYIPKEHGELDFIHYYRADAYLSEPKAPQYDFQFDYSKYLNRKDIGYQCYIPDEIFAAPKPDVNLREQFSQKRLNVLQNIDSTAMSSQSREFLKGIILADRTETDPQTVEDFNRSGLVHFLAISGTHIIVIFGLLHSLLVRIFPFTLRKYTIILSLIFIWLFAAFIGFGNSVVRSCIMLSGYFIYILLQRKPDLLHSLALSALIILMMDTRQIFDVGFQLSFLAVLGIFWLNQPILKYFPKQDHWFKKIIFNTISISISAQVFTLPLVLYYFHQFSLISIVANFIIVPFSELIIIFSFLMTGLIAFELDFMLINKAYDVVIHILLDAIHWFSGFQIPFFDNIAIHLMEVISLYWIIYLMRFAILKPNIKNSAKIIMAAFGFFILRIGLNFYEAQKAEVLFYDFKKYKVLSIKKRSKVCFWVDVHADQEKIIQFIVNPYCSSRRISGIEIRNFPDSAESVVYEGKMYNLR